MRMAQGPAAMANYQVYKMFNTRLGLSEQAFLLKSLQISDQNL